MHGCGIGKRCARDSELLHRGTMGPASWMCWVAANTGEATRWVKPTTCAARICA